jgi:hypothetical protein
MQTYEGRKVSKEENKERSKQNTFRSQRVLPTGYAGLYSEFWDLLDIMAVCYSSETIAL